MTLQLRRYGDRAWLIEGARNQAALARWLGEQDWPSTIEAVPAARTCLLRFTGPAPPAARVREVLATMPEDGEAGAGAGPDRPVVTIPVRYDGEDLAAVAELTGLSPRDVVVLHTSATYEVAFLGFAPGFGYLTGLPAALHLPRRSVPRVRVPAGSVAIADRYTAVYPRSSPGGWHLIGSTDLQMFDPLRRPPSLFAAGDRVRFEAVS